jgi:mannose-6-phosphate isomerase
MKAYPLKFKPIYKRRIWGGQRLQEVFGKDIPAGEKIGESWEIADLPEDLSARRMADKSIIANGELAGQTIGSAIEKYPKEIMGDEKFAGPFPLLIKFLDAGDILSVQVHPDKEACQRLGKGEPKTECWYIVSATDRAVIYKGVKKGVTKEKFAEAIKKGNAAEMLVKVTVREGECHSLPAGTAHSIGAGILIAEIQTPSDTTYRVYDWNRIDADGKKRELHIEEALESIHFGQRGDELMVTRFGRLADCENFKVDKGYQGKGSEVLIRPGEMKVLIIVSGRGTIAGAELEAVEFKAGDTILIPAAYMGTMRFKEATEYLTVTT